MRQIQVTLHAGRAPEVTVDGADLGPIAAVRVLGNQTELPAVQVEFRGEVTVDLPDGAVLEHMAGGDVSAILVDAIGQLDPAGLESAILAKLSSAPGIESTGAAAVVALKEWAHGYGSA